MIESSHLGMIGGMQFIPVGPTHDNYPPEPNTVLMNAEKSRVYVRDDEWETMRLELLRIAASTCTKDGQPK